MLHKLYEHTKFTSSLLPRAVVTMTIGYCLGADPSVKVVYKPISRVRGESGLINVSVNFTYIQVTEITNTRNEPTTVFFTDQIPLSRDDKLKVKRGGRERGEEERERERGPKHGRSRYILLLNTGDTLGAKYYQVKARSAPP